jgi:DNA repair protein RadD
MIPRPYQSEAVAAVWKHCKTRTDHPCVVLPTGTGKSIVMAMIVNDVVRRWKGRALILAHVKELLNQNAAEIAELCPGIDLGIYSAGLKSRDMHNAVVVAGIQSVYQRACEMGRFDVILIDEAHLIPLSGDGMYRQFIADAMVVNPNVRLIGLTATPFRLAGGMICQPDAILNEVCYELGLREAIADGYLTPLRSHRSKEHANMDDVKVVAGEYETAGMVAAMDCVVARACTEVVDICNDQARRCVMIFAANVEHANRVASEIQRITGEDCGVVTGDTDSSERATTIARFDGRPTGDLLRDGKPLRWMASVNALTTGLNVKRIDCIVLLRSTMSPGLLVQMIGRGTRLHPGKADCLVLDYGENLMTHGPVDAIKMPEGKRNAKGDDEPSEPPAKECQACHAVVAIAYCVCPVCGTDFPPPEKKAHLAHAGTSAVMSGEVDDWEYDVHAIRYEVHAKRGWEEGDPRTVRIDYEVGIRQVVSEWVCPEHQGFALNKFLKWWHERVDLPPPKTASAVVAIGEAGAIAMCARVTVRKVSGERFPTLINHVLDPIPDPSDLAREIAEQVDAPTPSEEPWEDGDDIPF